MNTNMRRLQLENLFNFKIILLLVLPIAIASSFFVDHISQTTAGYFLSFILFAIITILKFVDLRASYFFFIVVSLTNPRFSRELVLQIIDSGNTNVETFYSFHSVSIAGFSLSSLSIILFGSFALLNILLKNINLAREFVKNFTIVLSLVALLILSTGISVIDGNHLDLRAVVSDLRLYLVALCALFLFHYFVYKYGCDSVLRTTIFAVGFSTLIVGCRTLIFMFQDYLTSSFKPEFATEPYSAYAFMFALLMSRIQMHTKFPIVLVCFLGAISMKRLDIAFVALCIFICLFSFVLTKSKQDFLNGNQTFIFFTFMLSIVLVTLYIYLPSVLNFLLYKFSFFSEEIWNTDNMSGSASVRKYEFINIWHKNSQNIWSFLFGQGLGGYFDFERTGYPIKLGASDFSVTELQTGYYQKPHSFVNFMLLKGGLFLLTLYVFMFLYTILYVFKIKLKNTRNAPGLTNRRTHYWFIIFYSVFCLNMYWQPVHTFLFIVLYFTVFHKDVEHSN